MKKGTSLYLDMVRISAALMVFLEHFREHTRNSFGWFWRLHPTWYKYSDSLSLIAGQVVFVLSGYVIAHVLATRESNPVDYAASRLARLYSVMIPALILAGTTNYLEALRYPNAFDTYRDTPVALQFLGTALFVVNDWVWPGQPTPNLPLWRLSYEVVYYVGIAFFVFLKNFRLVAGLVILGLLAGPSIVLMAPTWLLGYVAYHFARRVHLPAAYAASLCLGSFMLLLVCPPIIQFRFRHDLSFLTIPDRTVGGLLAAYTAAVFFALHLFTFNMLSEQAEKCLRPFASVIRWLGSVTFALYMFHQPILSFFTVYPVGPSASERGSLAQAALLLGSTFVFVATVGHFCEKSKGAYKRFFLSLWERIAAVRLRYAALRR